MDKSVIVKSVKQWFDSGRFRDGETMPRLQVSIALPPSFTKQADAENKAKPPSAEEAATVSRA